MCHKSSPEAFAERIATATADLQLPLPASAADRLAAYLAELLRWNRAYNLTAVTGQDEMVRRHVLDSLSIRPFLRGRRILDAGTGAGLPGVVLAIAEPDRRFLLVDGNGKKVRFLRHVQRTLALDNIEPVQSRLESLALDPPPDEIVARALAPLPKLVEWTAPWLDGGARLLAMKGPRARDEAVELPDAHSVELHELEPAPDDARRLLAIVRRRS